MRIACSSSSPQPVHARAEACDDVDAGVRPTRVTRGTSARPALAQSSRCVTFDRAQRRRVAKAVEKRRAQARLPERRVDGHTAAVGQFGASHLAELPSARAAGV